MTKLKLIENGLKKTANKKRRGRRRNTATVSKRSNTATKTVAKVANRKHRRRRNTISSASVKAYAKRNSLKLVKKSNSSGSLKKVSNRKHHRRGRRRNTATSMFSSRNGLLGNSTETAKSVVSLLVGLGATKLESGIATPLVAQFLTPVGFGRFSKPVTEFVLAITVNKWAGDAIGRRVKAPQAGKFAMIGGLAMSAMSVLELLLPQTSAYNPFATINTNPISLGASQQGIVNGNVIAALAANQGVSPASMGSLMRMRQGTGYSRPALVRY